MFLREFEARIARYSVPEFIPEKKIDVDENAKR